MNWISIKEEEPPKDKAVLVAIFNQVDICYYDEKEDVFRDYFYKQIVNVTYWMPLPKPPKQ